MAEVHSPPTARTDLREKAVEYLRTPTLFAYVAFEQGAAKAWVWLRGEKGFEPDPTPITGNEKTIRLTALNLVLPFADIYRGVELS